MRARSWMVAVFAASVLGAPTVSAADTVYQGFGATTPGGSGGAIVHVTNLGDRGPGTLRDAISRGSRTVVFDVAGDIELSDFLYVSGAFVTIDGLSAPAPGITLRNRGLVIRGTRGAHDVIVRGIRVRNSSIDGIQVAYGAYNVVIDHVSVQGSGDGDIDITESSHDVTVSWSILAEPASEKTMLIKYNPSRVTLHHNLFVAGESRNPNASIDDLGTPATDTTADIRNNVIYDWGIGTGTVIHHGAWANVVNNYYSSPISKRGDQVQALFVCKGDCWNDPTSLAWGFTSGNVDADNLPFDINTIGNVTTPFAASAVDTQDACTAARDVVATAGMRPLDAVDAGYVSLVALTACGG